LFGDDGAGVVAEDGLQDKVELIMGTFSKALGGFGAYLATTNDIRDYLINTCRSFIYSTALPPSVIASNIAAIELLREEPLRRKKVLALSRYFRQALCDKGFQVRGTSQIIPVIVADNLKVLEAAAFLGKKGYWVLPVRPPTVPEGEARLRFSLTYDHDQAVLDKVVDDLQRL
jgi:7-keto-8-aminopelargonate synthetase-like enzyme